MNEKIFVAADDLTGALDTGVQFAQAGFSVRVLLQASGSAAPAGCDALVMNTCSRHMRPDKAKRVVQNAFARAKESRAYHYYLKKLDSTLRGNVGGELDGMSEALGAPLIEMIPAYPAAGRTTVGGRQYVRGVPLDQTAFARDPFEPVISACIAQIVLSQCALPVFFADGALSSPKPATGVRIHDASTDEDILQCLRSLENPRALAGCAGLAKGMARLLGGERRGAAIASPGGNLLVLCGSLNQTARRQVEYAVANGAGHLVLPDVFLYGDDDAAAEAVAQELLDGLQRRAFVADTPEPDWRQPATVQSGKRVAEKLGRLFSRVLQRRPGTPVAIVGGDTLDAALKSIGCRELVPLGEASPGVVQFRLLANGRPCDLFSKAGGLGGVSALADLANFVKESAFV